jgi:hypothetical protein
MFLPEIVGQLGIGHQVEPHQLHGSSFRTAFTNSIDRNVKLRREPVNPRCG